MNNYDPGEKINIRNKYRLGGGGGGGVVLWSYCQLMNHH